MKVTKRKAKGVLADMIANIDEDSLAKTRDEMMRITEDYCSPKVSKLLRDKGLGQEHFHHYVGVHNDDGTSEAVSVCTHQIAMKWLREEKMIIISLFPIFKSSPTFKNRLHCSWRVEIKNCFGEELGGNYEYITYKEAVEAALKYCLTELI